MKCVLVTGAAGFIGFHLCKKLIDEGFRVYGIDNLNAYYDVRLKLDRLTQLGIDVYDEHFLRQVEVKSNAHAHFRFHQIDITDEHRMDQLFQTEKFDIVINLAAQAGVRYSIDNPKVYVQSNIVGFINVLEACRHNAVEHLIYASSSSVYGNQDKVPFSESDPVDHPVSLYAATKKSNELMAHVYSHLYGLKTTGLRFFTVYGPWGRPDMAPFLFARSILNEQPIKLFNNGELMRDFTYVDDIVHGVLGVVKNTDINLKYNIYNIGNNTPTKLIEFINSLERICGKKAIIENYPM
ncbi:MAG: NAD-dependent epimerase/dehydratase family protein, partial [Sediminibacterium sp.]